MRAGALLPTTDSWNDSAKTEESSRALRYYPALPSDKPVETPAVLFEDNGLQTTNASDQHVIHDFRATSTLDKLSVVVTHQGTWTLPYDHMRVVLPESEKRSLNLQSSGVRLTR